MRNLSRLLQRASEVEKAMAAFRAALIDDSEDTGAQKLDSEHRPSGVSRRTFNLTCRSGAVAGASKDGRTWSCSRAAWNEARARKPKAQRSSLHLVPPPSDDEQIAEAAMAGAGLRSTRGGR